MLLMAICVCFVATTVVAQCPWQRDIPDLQTSCICSYNLGRELSVQCDQVGCIFTKQLFFKMFLKLFEQFL